MNCNLKNSARKPRKIKTLNSFAATELIQQFEVGFLNYKKMELCEVFKEKKADIEIFNVCQSCELKC